MRWKVGQERVSDTTVRLTTSSGCQINLFATPDVPIDSKSVQEVEGIGEIQANVDALKGSGYFGDDDFVHMLDCILTPDFHKGSGVPVGTVMETSGFIVPKSAGSDIGCGMRFSVADVDEREFVENADRFETEFRRMFFEGGRDLPLSETSREGVLREGIGGVAGAIEHGGLWADLGTQSLRNEMDRNHSGGCWPTRDTWMFGDFIRGSGGVSRDAAIGSIGGGNHFVEIQAVDQVLHGGAAREMGIRAGQIGIMIHSGSLGLGSAVGSHFMALATSLCQRYGVMSASGFDPLPLTGPHGDVGRAYVSAMSLAANFAVVNRLAMRLMVDRVLSRVLGRQIESKAVYDAPHNLIWPDVDGAVVHRKGACPAGQGMPVILPGSMGDNSWILSGLGSKASIMSSPHGSGRATSRGEGRRRDAAELDPIRVVTPVDFRKITRRDILDEKRRELMEEAPSNYKPSLPALQTVEQAGIASVAARLRPLMTVKG